MFDDKGSYASRARWLVMGGLPLLLSGCGGGGSVSGPPASTPTRTVTITGSAAGPTGAPVSGLTVTFDNQVAATGATNSSGVFTLTVPVTAVQSSDALTFTDSTGQAVGLKTITVNATAGSTTNVGTVTTYTSGPPAPPNSI